MDQNNNPIPPADQAERESAEQRVRSLEEREAALDRREREIRLRTALRGRELPETLVGCLDLSSDERADEGLEALAKAFHDAVTQRVRDRLGGDPPKAAGAPDALAAVRKAMGLK